MNLVLKATLLATLTLASSLAPALAAADPVAAVFERPATPLGPRASDATLKRNVAAARRFAEEVLGKGDPKAFDELVAEDVWVSTGLKPDAPVRGKAEYGKVLGTTVGAVLTNGKMIVHEVLPITDGRVLVRFTAEADHTGALDGLPAMNRRIYLSETHLLRFRNGKLIENYVGALNPLTWEMYYAPVIGPKVLGR